MGKSSPEERNGKQQVHLFLSGHKTFSLTPFGLQNKEGVTSENPECD